MGMTVMMAVSVVMAVLVMMVFFMIMGMVMRMAFFAVMAVLMRMAFFAVMAVLMRMALFAVMAVLMRMALFAVMIMVMGMPLLTVMAMPMLMPLFLQMHIKIIRIQAALHRPAKMKVVSFYSQAVQRMLQHRLVGAKIQKRSNRHISADSRITFQIQYFSHLFHRQSVYLRCQIARTVSIVNIYHGNPVCAGIQHG